jgi:hypothetical protein
VVRKKSEEETCQYNPIEASLVCQNPTTRRQGRRPCGPAGAAGFHSRVI